MDPSVERLPELEWHVDALRLNDGVVVEVAKTCPRGAALLPRANQEAENVVPVVR
jgi:hypothetical protein